MMQPLGTMVWHILTTLNIYLPYDPTITLLDISLEK